MSRAACIRKAVLGRISRGGDMHHRVRDTTLESLLSTCGLDRETNLGGSDGFREIDAVALETLAVLGPRISAMHELIIRLHHEGVLSEGQVANATGLDRFEIRRRTDEWVRL